jgi:hypothetical protein
MADILTRLVFLSFEVRSLVEMARHIVHKKPCSKLIWIDCKWFHCRDFCSSDISKVRPEKNVIFLKTTVSGICTIWTYNNHSI